MQFSGNNLTWVAYALELADAELHNQIATCPDVNEYADFLEELEEERAYLGKLLERVREAIAKEEARKPTIQERK